MSGIGGTRRTSGRITLHLEMMVAPSRTGLAHLGRTWGARFQVDQGAERGLWCVARGVLWRCGFAFWRSGTFHQGCELHWRLAWPGLTVENAISRRQSERRDYDYRGLVTSRPGPGCPGRGGLTIPGTQCNREQARCYRFGGQTAVNKAYE